MPRGGDELARRQIGVRAYTSGAGCALEEGNVRIEHVASCDCRRCRKVRIPTILSHACYGWNMSSGRPQMESLSQRELRNESGRVLRAVGEGHSFVLTNHGVPVGRIVPLDAPAPTLPIARPARRDGGWAELAIDRKTSDRSLAATLDDLRGERL